MNCDLICTQLLPVLFAPLILLLTAECTPEEAFSIVGDNIIFASGSPFKDVDLGMHSGFYVLL